MSVLDHSLTAAFRRDRRYVWAICYRMTGSAADADDLLQETFARAAERPPARVDVPLRPWLARVAVNLSLDLVRQRQRRGYRGPWLPSPIEPPSYEIAGEQGTTAARYDLLESVSFAFLLALEALSPVQRAVLLLRDVFDYSGRETAVALAMSEANVKTSLHRARKKMAAYDTRRCLPSSELTATTRRRLQAMLAAMAAHDVDAAEKLLARDARALNDGGGEFRAALNPIRGASQVARLCVGLAQKHVKADHLAWRQLNGLPAVIITLRARPAGIAPRIVLRCDVNAAGQISEIHAVMASRKLTHVHVGPEL